MEHPTPEQMWAAYMERVRVGYDIKEVGNFLGSVEMHKKWFIEAMTVIAQGTTVKE
jgi:hypothetical protein